MVSKRIGKVFEGRWKIISTLPANGKNHRTVYILENIYNGRKMNVDSRQIQRIESGKSSLSSLIVFRIRSEKERRL